MQLKRGDTVVINGTVHSNFYEPDPKGAIRPGDSIWGEYPYDIEIGSIIVGDSLDGKWPSYRYRYLYKHKCQPTHCIVLGWTQRKIGRSHRGYMAPANSELSEEWEPGYLDVEKTFKVWMVMPISENNQYRQPLCVLPDQIHCKVENGIYTLGEGL